jgi:hypothetical protein
VEIRTGITSSLSPTAIYKKVFYQEHVPLSGAGDPGLSVYQKRSESIQDSAMYLANLGEVPVHIIPCVESRFEDAGTFRQATRYGSILPAAWSLMLALRGLGTAWTTLHLYHEKEVAALLGIPNDVTQVVHLSVAYYTGADLSPGCGSLLVHGHTGTFGDRTARLGHCTVVVEQAHPADGVQGLA